MSIQVSNSMLLVTTLGGETVRLEALGSDGTARKLTLTDQTKDDTVITLPDLATGLTKTVWNAATSNLRQPLAIVLLLDPANTYADDLSRTSFAAGKSPCVIVEISTADASSGVLITPTSPANESVSLRIGLYREFPLVIPTNACASATTGTTIAMLDRAINKIQARSNMASGFGPVKLRCLVLG